MSADNYMHIIRRDGKYVVQDRSASSFYRDEGWSDDDPPTYEPYGGGIVEKHPEWIEDTPSWGVVFDTFEEADNYAHSEYSEYGVSYGFEVGRSAVPVDEEERHG